MSLDAHELAMRLGHAAAKEAPYTEDGLAGVISYQLIDGRLLCKGGRSACRGSRAYRFRNADDPHLAGLRDGGGTLWLGLPRVEERSYRGGTAADRSADLHWRNLCALLSLSFRANRIL